MTIAIYYLFGIIITLILIVLGIQFAISGGLDPNKCPHCGYDCSKYPAGLEVGTGYIKKECPNCHQTFVFKSNE